MNLATLLDHRLPDDHVSGLKLKQTYINAVARLEYPNSHIHVKNAINLVAQIHGDKNPPSSSTVIRWFNSARKSPMKASDENGCGSRGDYAHPLNRQIFAEVIDDYYFRRNPLNRAGVWRKFEERYLESCAGDSSIEAAIITSRSFYTWIERLDHLEKVRAQEGSVAASLESRSARRRHVPVELLERVEIDAVHIFLWHRGADQKSHKKIILYVALEVSTRMIMGYHIQTDDEDETKKLGETLDGYRACILKSIDDNEDIDAWPARGMFSLLIADSALVLTSNAFDQFSSVIGLCIKNVPVGKGWHKPHIERFFGTLRTGFLQGLPGYLGKRANPTGESATKAPDEILTIEEFQAALENFIVNDYHHTPHKGLGGKTPFEAWEEAEDRLGEPYIPNSIDDAATVRCHTASAILGRHGVRRQHLDYFNEDLHSRAVRDGAFKKKTKVTVYYDRNDMGAVTVLYNGVKYEAVTSVIWAHGLTEKQWANLTPEERVYGPKPEATEESAESPQKRKPRRRRKRPAQDSATTNQDAGNKTQTAQSKADTSDSEVSHSEDLEL